MAKEFFYKLMGEVRGPVAGQKLKELADSGAFDRGTHVSTDRKRWVTAEHVHGLFAAVVEAESRATEEAPLQQILDDSWQDAAEPKPLATDTLQSSGSFEPLDSTPISRGATPPRLPRRPANGLSVSGILAQVIYFLDLKFERYLTPQLIRIFWALSLVLAIVGLGISALGGLPYAFPHRVKVENVIPSDVQQKMAILSGLIAENEREESARSSRRSPTRSDVRPPDSEPKVSVDSFTEQYRAYAQTAVTQLRAELTKLEKQFPKDHSEWVFRNSIIYVLSCLASLLTSLLMLLVVRISCELFAVVFNIATHLSLIRDSLSRQFPAAPLREQLVEQ